MADVIDLDALRTELHERVSRATAWRFGQTPDEAVAFSRQMRQRIDTRLPIKKAMWWLEHCDKPRTPSYPG